MKTLTRGLGTSGTKMGFVLNYMRNMASVALGREPTRPLLFSYYVTHRCELNCRYCCDGDGLT